MTTRVSRALSCCALLLCVAGLVQAGQSGSYRWFDGGRPTAQALAVLAQLRAAGEEGLQPEYYGAAALTQRFQTVSSGSVPGAAVISELDAALSKAAVQLANDLHRGHVDPRSTGLALRRGRAEVDAGAWLSRLAASHNVAAEFRALEPQFLHYRLLEQWLVKYRQLAQQEPTLTVLPPLPARSVKPDGKYAGADALRHLLAALGDLPSEEAAARNDGLFDATLSAALMRFQQRHGLTVDGTLGNKTFAALVTPLQQRIRQIELSLERWRWLPEFTSPPIIINIPQFRLFAFRGLQDRVADILQMDVIVGESYRRKRTPVFVAELQQVVFRPYWDVPPSILKNELLPLIRRDASYLARNEMEMVRGPGDDARVVDVTPENIEALAAGQLRLRQRAGEKNALGAVKFVFPNDFGVYLHSTPAQQLFAHSRRDFSHGCIRVSEPAALAVHVLSHVDGGWSMEQVLAAMQGEPNRRIRLPQPIPVMVLYATALATEDGRILFFDDIYGHDRRLAQWLPGVARQAY